MLLRRSAALPALSIAGVLFAVSMGAGAATAASTDNPTSDPTIYPQIVRLSYVEGDVRIARGKAAEKADKSQNGAITGWEQAATGLPLEAGYSLATGEGRAEIELENASTLYLAPHSLLTLDSLESQNRVTYTEASLLSGSLVINNRSQTTGDKIHLTSPTDHLTIGYTGWAVWRVDSYLDAIAITRLAGTPPVRTPGAVSTPLGQTVAFSHSRRISAPTPPDPDALAAWDNWALRRITDRQSVLDATMKQAGLAQPLPGLDQLVGKGTFFSCGEYGTCWEPNAGWDGKREADVATTDPAAEALRKWTVSVKDVANPGAPVPPGGIPSKSVRPSPVDNYLTTHPGATFYTEDYTFPCQAYSVRELYAVDPLTRKEKLIASEFDTTLMDPYMTVFPRRGAGLASVVYAPLGAEIGYASYWQGGPWDWTVCHTGTWIRWNHRYVWVAGLQRHYHCPVYWVHNGHAIGYVPIHPHDVAGKAPVNLKDGLLRVDGKSLAVQRVEFDQGKGIKLLSEPPKEFRNPQFATLKIAEVPHAETRSVWGAQRDTAIAIRNGEAGIGSAYRGAATGLADAHHEAVADARHTGAAGNPASVPITFDRKTQSFSITREVAGEGAHTNAVSTRIGGGQAFGPTGAGGWSNAHAGGNSGGGGNSNNAGTSGHAFSGSNGGGNQNAGGNSSARGFSGPSGGSSNAGSRSGGGGYSGGSSGGASHSGGGGYSGGGGGYSGGSSGGASHSGGGGSYSGGGGSSASAPSGGGTSGGASSGGSHK